MELEEKAAVEIDLGDLAVYPSVNSLAKYVAAKSAKE
jgi:acyl carrier protein